MASFADSVTDIPVKGKTTPRSNSSTLNLTPRASHSKEATGKRKAPKSIMKTSKKRKTPGGSYLATFTGSVQKTKKKNTLFISVPQVHEFQTDSPVTFRLPTSSKKSVEKMDANECDKVLEFMGKKSNITSPTKKKRAVLKVATDTLKNKLSYLGIVSPTDDLDELKNRVEFLKKLERQAHLRYAVGEDLTTYSVESLAMQLMEKKEKVQQVDARREILEDRLAAALLKESDNFRVGQGYDHGLRFMTTTERLEEYTHQELYKELKTKFNKKKVPRKKEERRAMLTEEVEKQCKSQLVQHFKDVLISELQVRNLPTETSEMIAYMADLKKERDAALEAKAREDEEADDDDGDGLVSSPSAKRRKLSRTNSLHDEDLDGEGYVPNVKSTILLLNYLPPLSFLKKSTPDQIRFEVLFAYMCMNALTVKPSISLQRRNSCEIL